MYDYFLDKDFLKRAQNLCSEIVTDIQDEVRAQGISCQFFLIGSGARNMITYQKRKDGEIYIDFDYNLNIMTFPQSNEEKTIKEIVRKAFNKVWKKRYGKECASDSTSALTSDFIYFKDSPKINFSFDLGIVKKNNNGEWFRLIHNKMTDSYFWNPVRNSKEVSKKAAILKKNNHWDGEESVRKNYLTIKNNYLRQNDEEHPSFVCYIEAVNKTFNKWGNK